MSIKPHRKISAHIVYTVSSDPVYNGIVCVAEDGTIISVEKQKDGHEDFNTEFFNGIIVPGFVNTHCHLELSHLKNVFDDNCSMPGFLEQMRTKRTVNSENAADFASLYDSRMYREGVSVCADIVNSTITAEIKKNSRIHYINFIELFGLRPGDSEAILKRAEEIKSLYANSHIAPHALYSLSDNLFSGIKKLLGTENISSVHYMESQQEIEYFNGFKGELATSLSEIEPVRPAIAEKGIHGMLGELFAEKARLLLVHNSFSDKEDAKFIEKRFPGSYRVLCPVSNQFITGTLPDVKVFNSDRICIGTDSLASNRDLTMISEMRMLHDAYPELKFEEILKWATLNGADALQVDNVYGKIEPGMKPGLVLIENFNFQKMKLDSKTIARRLV